MWKIFFKNAFKENKLEKKSLQKKYCHTVLDETQRMSIEYGGVT